MNRIARILFKNTYEHSYIIVETNLGIDTICHNSVLRFQLQIVSSAELSKSPKNWKTIIKQASMTTKKKGKKRTYTLNIKKINNGRM